MGWGGVAGRLGISTVLRLGWGGCGPRQLAVLCGLPARLVRGVESGLPGSAPWGRGPGLFVPRCALRRWVRVAAAGDVLWPVIAGLGCVGRWRVVRCGLSNSRGWEQGSWNWVFGSAAGLGGGGGGLWRMAMLVGCGRGVAGCAWCSRVRSLGRPPTLVLLGRQAAFGRRPWLSGLELGIVSVSVGTSCRALVRVWAMAIGVALVGVWGLGVGTGVWLDWWAQCRACGLRALTGLWGMLVGVCPWSSCGRWCVGVAFGGGGLVGR